MEQIVYISTARALVPGAAMLKDILSTSRRNNHRDGLTGVLVVGGCRFLQAIEGPRQSLDQAYRRIQVDERHFALVQLSRKPITTRSFPDWDMAFEQGGSADNFDDLAVVVARMTDTLDDPDLKAQLRSFADLHARAA